MTNPVPNDPDSLLRSRVEFVRERIAAACARAGRDAVEVSLVAVTKNFPVEFARKACASGIQHLGENRVQEMIEKFGDGWLPRQFPEARLHLVGHLQSNKVRKALQVSTTLDSLDSVSLAVAVSTEAVQAGKTVRVLIEVNTSGEPQKYGIEPEQLENLIEASSSLPNLAVSGLMTVGPKTVDESAIHQSFATLRRCFEKIKTEFHSPDWKVLSMGMSGDYDIAIEEGATEIRLGTALFGPRSYP